MVHSDVFLSLAADQMIRCTYIHTSGKQKSVALIHVLPCTILESVLPLFYYNRDISLAGPGNLISLKSDIIPLCGKTMNLFFYTICLQSKWSGNGITGG